MNKKTAEILVIYSLIIFICIKVYQMYSRSTDIYSIPLLLLALLIGLILGTIVNLMYFKFKKRDKDIHPRDKGIHSGVEGLNSSESHKSMVSNRKEFVDATVNNYQYGQLLLVLLAVFIWLIYALYSYFKNPLKMDEPSATFLTITISVFFLLVVSFIFLRKYWTSEIITDDRGITFVGLLKKRHIDWTKVIALEMSESLLGNVAEGKIGKVKTREGDYFFSLAMKEKNQPYPKFINHISKVWWEDSEGNKKKINAENCPLYVEIQKRLRL